MNYSDTHVSLEDSSDSHGAVVNIVSWLLLIFSSLAVLTRLGTKWAVTKQFHMDDVMIIISQVSHTVLKILWCSNCSRPLVFPKPFQHLLRFQTDWEHTLKAFRATKL